MRIGALLIALSLFDATMAAAQDGDELSVTAYVETGREFEAERANGAATGIALDAAFAHVGFDAEAGKTIFGASIGPRRLRGEVDFRPVLFDIDAEGFRAAAYIGREIASGVFAGAYGAYQKESGELESPFLTLGAELEGFEIAPFIGARLPIRDGEIEAAVALQIENGSIEIEFSPEETFTYVYGVAAIGASHPIGRGFAARGGAEARYIFRDDPILGSATRDRFSVRFYGGFAFDLDETARLVIEGDVRAFQSRTRDHTLLVRVARDF